MADPDTSPAALRKWAERAKAIAATTSAVNWGNDIALVLERLAAEKEAGAPDDWPAEANEAAQRVLTSLGYSVSPSLEPGADHRRDRIAVIFDQYAKSIAAQNAAPAPAPDGWIPWFGGECPVDGGKLVSVRFRGGTEDRDLAEEWVWSHDLYESDIIAYRIAEGPRP